MARNNKKIVSEKAQTKKAMEFIFCIFNERTLFSHCKELIESLPEKQPTF